MTDKPNSQAILRDAFQRGLDGGKAGALAMTIQVWILSKSKQTFINSKQKGLNFDVDADNYELSIPIWDLNYPSHEALMGTRGPCPAYKL